MTRAEQIEKAARKIRGGPEGCLTEPNCGACAWCNLDRALALPPDPVADATFLRNVVALARAEPDLPDGTILYQAGLYPKQGGLPPPVEQASPSLDEWASGVAFLGLTRGFVLAREGAERPPSPDGTEVSLVLDAAGPAPVPEAGAGAVEALRDAADLIELRFKVKQPHKNLWLEIVQAVRSLANKAEKAGSRKSKQPCSLCQGYGCSRCSDPNCRGRGCGVCAKGCQQRQP